MYIFGGFILHIHLLLHFFSSLFCIVFLRLCRQIHLKYVFHLLALNYWQLWWLLTHMSSHSFAPLIVPRCVCPMILHILLLWGLGSQISFSCNMWFVLVSIYRYWVCFGVFERFACQWVNIVDLLWLTLFLFVFLVLESCHLAIFTVDQITDLLV